ncbi:MAG: hypothetical protein PHT96_11330 [Syntrophorhabdaceae bacterium]|nr:hypothetical protein [Syntrophorhabdaceae bacterium]MDD4196975.1 hypothetical protein [Syntrophorhabdaceae bacterium]
MKIRLPVCLTLFKMNSDLERMATETIASLNDAITSFILWAHSPSP